MVHGEIYEKESELLKMQNANPKDSSILKLDPVMDSTGVIRIRGRLKHLSLAVN